MARDGDRKAELVDRLADHVLAQGMAAASLRALAAAVGTSDRMLLYYFPDKAALMAAVLGAIADRMMVLLDANRAETPMEPLMLQTHLMPMVSDPAVAPFMQPFMQLWLEIAALAARGDKICQHVGGTIAHGFVTWLAGQIDVADPTSRTNEAWRLLIAIEGAVLLNSLGLGDDVRRATTTPLAVEPR